jgi:RecB family endonuclease NucS
MLVPIKLTEEKGITAETSLADSTFKSLGLKEAHIEEFLSKNIHLIFNEEDDEEPTLLIVGQQVINNSGGRNDLVALDGNGDLVLIEIKRDAEDMAVRSEPMELQAIRYAASLATIKNYEELVDKVFAPSINKRKDEFELELKELTPGELGRRKVQEFLKENDAENIFNGRQRIILVASGFDEQIRDSLDVQKRN